SQGACSTAPNCPHVYKNGLKLGENKKLRWMEWGQFRLTNGLFGEIICQSSSVGFSENPLGGGNAKGEFQGLIPYECIGANCHPLLELAPEHLPWRVEVTEPSSGVFRQNTGKKGEKGGAGSIEILFNCNGTTKVPMFGEISPLIQNNGTVI